MNVMIIIKYMKFYPQKKFRNKTIINMLIEKYKDMLEYPDFEQNHYSRTAESIYKIDRY